MHVNQMVVALAVAKRDAEADAEYEEAMEEIEERKKTCKALEYAGHATDLVTNLIGDIPEIPLVTDTIKIAASGVAAVAHVAEFGMNIAATAMECDDVNFDEIKLIMDKRFNEVDRKLDKMTEAMEQVTEMVTKTLNSVEKTRTEMNWGFKNILATLKNFEIQSILSKINKFSRYFNEKRNEISKLPADQFVFKLKEKDGILEYLKKARMPEGLHADLFELMDKNTNYAIPENANDAKAFQALYALFYGTQTYAAIMFFLLKQHSYLADYYYQKGNDKEFNDEFDTLKTTFNEFKTSLTGSKGLINEVIKTLDEVKNKDFIRYVKNDLYENISNREDSLKELKTKITTMEIKVIDDIPQSVDDIDFKEPTMASNYGEWDDKSKVRYAVQLRKNGIYSKFSDWTEPLKVEGKANPVLTVPRDEAGRERLVFRKFNDEKPELAGILTKSQVEFRDISRDLYNAARRKDQTKPLEYIPLLIEKGAKIDAVFEMKRTILHAAAESGNVKIAMRFLLREGAVDAKDEKGFTAMHIAASTRNSGFVHFLIDQKANVNAQTTLEKLTPLHMAAKKGYIKTVKNLLESEKIEPNTPEKSGYTALHYAVRGTAKALKTMASYDKVNVNAKSDFGLTPFHLAVMKGDKEFCDALLDSGKVEVNAVNKNGMTPLHFAAMAGNVNMIRYLLSGNEKVKNVEINAVTSDNHWTPLFYTIYFKKEEAALELLNHPNVNITIASKENVTPLQLSVATGQVKVFDKLLEKGSNIEAKSNEGFTALHLAALRKETDFTRKLLDKKANIDAVADDKSTPLHLAAKSDKKDEILLLIEEGANMKLYDNKTFVAFQYSIKNINLEAMKAFVKKDASVIDPNTDVGESIGQYSVDFIFGSIHHYYKNKDSMEYRKYKDLQPLEIFEKEGLYSIARIVVNDPSQEDMVKALIETADKLATYCMKRESNPDEKPCPYTDIRSRRSIRSIDTDKFSYFTKLPSGGYSRNLIGHTNNLKPLGINSNEGSQSFFNAEARSLQNIDTNGMLLLADLLVRKLTNGKHSSHISNPTSKLESQARALELVEKISNFLDAISDVPAEELIDLAKLHSDLHRAIEGEKKVKIIKLVCEHLKNFVDSGQIEAFLSTILPDSTIPADQKQLAEICLAEINKSKE